MPYNSYGEYRRLKSYILNKETFQIKSNKIKSKLKENLPFEIGEYLYGTNILNEYVEGYVSNIKIEYYMKTNSTPIITNYILTLMDFNNLKVHELIKFNNCSKSSKKIKENILKQKLKYI